MATTKSMLVERVLKILEASPSTRALYSRNQIAHELNSFLSAALRLQIWEGYKDGERSVDGCVLATYTDIPIVRRDNGRSVATLPVTPMSLPKGAGVYKVYPSGYPEREFIPVSSGMLYALQGDKRMSVFGPKTYTYSNRSITINTEAVGAGADTLDMELVVTDITALGDNEILPIPADLEANAIAGVLQLLGVQPNIVRADDKSSPSNQLQR